MLWELCFFPGGGGVSRRCRRQPASERERARAAAGSGLWQLLVGMRVVAATGLARVLGHSPGGIARRGCLGKSVATFGGESTAGSRQRVSGASPVVSEHRHGCTAGNGFCRGRERSLVSLSGSSAGTQAGTVSVAAPEVGRSVSSRLRSAAL